LSTASMTTMVAVFQAACIPKAAAIERDYRERKEEYPKSVKSTTRQMMQTHGTEWGRECVDPNIWVNTLEPMILDMCEQGLKVVIDDMRFQNELDMINKIGGHTVKIVRRTMDQIPVHSSEGALTHQPFDSILTNNGTLEELDAQVTGMFA